MNICSDELLKEKLNMDRGWFLENSNLVDNTLEKKVLL
jgi:hypothetical protein